LRSLTAKSEDEQGQFEWNFDVECSHRDRFQNTFWHPLATLLQGWISGQ